MDTLSRSRPITMAIMRPEYSLRAVPDHYELAPHGRLAWLQRLLWRALHKMRALRLGVEEFTSYKTVTIDADRVAELIEQAEGELWGRSRRPERILIGPAEMSELMHDGAWMDFATHSAPTEFRTYRGMAIEVVPHMQGVLVL